MVECSTQVPMRGLRFPRYTRCKLPAVVERDGRSYCKIHDPEYVKKKRDERRADFERGREVQTALEKSASKLAKQLGVGSPHYYVGLSRSSLGGYTGGLVLTADEAKQLIRRLKGGSTVR